MSNSNIYLFYKGIVCDDKGRSIKEILSKKGESKWLENTHDYIQWLFPLDVPSEHILHAPILSLEDNMSMRKDETCIHNMRGALDMMLDFYDMQPTSKDGKNYEIIYTGNKKPNWLRKGNHNLLRLTRIMKFLNLLGFVSDSYELCNCLFSLNRKYRHAITHVTLLYWSEASRQSICCPWKDKPLILSLIGPEIVKSRNVYLAGPFFDNNELYTNSLIEEILVAKGLNVFVPRKHTVPDGEKMTNEDWGKAVFEMDRDALEKMDAVVLAYEGLYSDSGTAWECGYAYAKRIPVIVVRILPQLNKKNNTTDSLMIINGNHAVLNGLEELEQYDFIEMPKQKAVGEQK